MDIQVLGSLEVVGSDAPIDVGGPRQRRLLAALLVNANSTVSTDSLIEVVFEGAPPKAAQTTIRSYVSRLRRSLNGEPATIESGSGGYSFQFDLDTLDATRFARAAALGREQIDDQLAIDATETLRSALDLWRGPAFGEFAFEEWARGEAVRLDELRVEAEENLIDAQLACGLTDDVIPELLRLIETYPLRERLRYQLVLAQYRAGRQAEALRTFEHYRSDLIGVGLEPAAELVALERSIAVHDPSLQLVAPAGRALRGYRLGASLGVGGDGEVFRAAQPVIGREVAVKVIRPELADDPSFVRNFDRTAQRVSRLEHPHIVPLYDYWREPGAAYVVMRLLPRDLTTRLGTGPVDPPEAAFMAQQLGSALVLAHGLGVVHGSVKASNVLIDDDGNFYLSDFGLADLDAMSETRADQGRAGDQFDLAVLLGYALTGVKPFGDRGAASSRDAFPSVHTQRPSIPAAVDAVLWKAAAWDPGERYADVGTFVDMFVEALGGERRETTDNDVVNPFRGLEAFTEADAEVFFGRDDVVEEVLGRFDDHTGDDGDALRFVTVIGASGSGKSSLVRAGVVPRIRAGAITGSSEWFIATMVPGPNPLADLERALQSIATPAASDEREATANSDHTVDGLLRAAVAPGQPVLLIIDQLEELFTQTPEEDRNRFIQQLTAAVSDPDSNLRVLTTLRADFHDRPLRYSEFGRLVADGAISVVAMNAEQLDQAIRAPAARVGAEVEPAVASEIVATLVDQPAALPLLQFTLTELFDRRSGRVMTLAAYRELGGVDAAVARRADEVFDELTDAEQHVARRLFLRLVDVDDNGAVTRRRVLRSELSALSDGEHGMDDLIDSFGAARLLTFDRDAATREPTLELAHESLISSWPRLRTWVFVAGEGLHVQNRLTAAAAQWQHNDHDRGDLYRGGRLEAALEWADESGETLTARESEFLHASAQAQEAEEAAERRHLEQKERSNRRLRVMIGAVAVALVVALVAGFLAIGQRNEARTEARRSQGRQLLASSAATLDSDPELSTLLALEVAQNYPDELLPDATQALQSALLNTRLIMEVPSSFATRATFSPDGDSFVTSRSDDDSVIQVWHANSRSAGPSLVGNDDTVLAAFHSPDGDQIATSGLGGIWLWNAASGKLEQKLTPPLPSLKGAFSNDGSMVAGTGFGGTVFVYDLTTGESTALPALSESGWTQGVAFSPDDSLLAVADNGDGPGCAAIAAPTTACARAALWDVGTGQLVHSFQGHASAITDVEFSPDGRLLYSSSKDTRVKIWDLATFEEVGAFAGHRSEIHSMDLSSDGAKMVSGSSDGRVIVWDVATLEVETEFRAHEGIIDSVELSPDGARVLTTSQFEGVTRVWNVAPNWRTGLLAIPGQEPSGSPSQEQGAIGFAPSGSSLVVARGDELIVWSVPDGQKIGRLPGSGTSTRSIAVSPDGSLVAVAGDDGAAVYDLLTGALVAEPIVGARAASVAFSPDGSSVVATGRGAVLMDLETREAVTLVDPRFWAFTAEFRSDGERVAVSRTRDDVAAPELVTFDGLVEVFTTNDFARVGSIPYGVTSGATAHERQVIDLVYSEDGELFATGSVSDVVIWDAVTLIEDPVGFTETPVFGEGPASRLGGSADIAAVAFAPPSDSDTSRRIALGTSDGLVTIWNLDTGEVELTLNVGRPVADISYSPDGRYLAATDPDGWAGVYILDTSELIEHATNRLTRTFTEAECQQYLRLESCPEPAA